MKEMYLAFNPLICSYIYYETILGKKEMKNRKELGSEESSLIQKLSFIDLKRNSILHLEDVPSEEAEKLKIHFSKSKVVIK
jgi:hypothetical protein